MAAKDMYGKQLPSSSGLGAFSVTPHDSNELAFITRGVWVGTGGAISVKMYDGNDVTFSNVLSGTLLPIAVSVIKSTGTDATGIVGLY